MLFNYFRSYNIDTLIHYFALNPHQTKNLKKLKTNFQIFTNVNNNIN